MSGCASVDKTPPERLSTHTRLHGSLSKGMPQELQTEEMHDEANQAVGEKGEHNEIDDNISRNDDYC
jgi:hypothetical protein